jgi:hypothetical protein
MIRFARVAVYGGQQTGSKRLKAASLNHPQATRKEPETPHK